MKVANPLAKRGEDLAASYLQKHGYQILKRNFHIRGGEIDIVAVDKSEKEHVLAFIEVKTRTSNQFGTPFEAITPWKMRSLIKSAQVFAVSHKFTNAPLRIDAVSVMIVRDEVKIELLKNIQG